MHTVSLIVQAALSSLESDIEQPDFVLRYVDGLPSSLLFFQFAPFPLFCISFLLFCIFSNIFGVLMSRNNNKAEC